MASNKLRAALPLAGDSFDEGWCARIKRARDVAVAALRRERGAAPNWTGELSASALSTATAVTALTLMARGAATDAGAAAEPWRDLIRRGRAWLIQHQNPDGGWGDTTRSKSNISTTTLGWAALGLEPADTVAAPALAAAERWLCEAAGSLAPERLVDAIEQRYGSDRTFSIPILTMCALCGRLGAGDEGWRHVRQLPFEVAALPQRWFGALRLPVVSYALPALIAIGQVRHAKRPTANPVWRGLRDRCRARTLGKLLQLQPANGGFLEAAPLTSFVTMSLAACGLGAHPVAQRGAAFLVASARADGSWPIDTNLATWLTTLSVQALRPTGALNGSEGEAIRAWLLAQQGRIEHPYTLAAPGGWAWTDLPGGVPDADDTAGAMLALMRLGAASEGAGENAQHSTLDAERSRGAAGRATLCAAVAAGARWLLDLQNRDGGIPTFCRGWGKLPFDRSSPDITAHAIRAWCATRAELASDFQPRIGVALARAGEFLRKTQRGDGAWVPLWFGHQEDPADENPLYGTARVVPALCELERAGGGGMGDALDRGVRWLVAKQNADGGWSGAAGAASSMEETGLAVEALAAAWERAAVDAAERAAMKCAIERGAAWLADGLERERWREATPIGFYFAKLWYFERLYPLIFATGALTKLAHVTRLD